MPKQKAALLTHYTACHSNDTLQKKNRSEQFKEKQAPVNTGSVNVSFPENWNRIFWEQESASSGHLGKRLQQEGNFTSGVT